MITLVRRRARFCAATVGLVALVALAGCLPPSTAEPPASSTTTTTTTTTTTLPPSPPAVGSVAIMGQSDLTAAQLVAFYTSHDPSTLPYRATGATLSDLATMFVTEGNRYNVRGDIAFAQSIVETAWLNFPDY